MGGAVTLFVIERAWAEDAAASALTEAVLAFAKENGFEQLNLEVRSDNARAKVSVYIPPMEPPYV